MKDYQLEIIQVDGKNIYYASFRDGSGKAVRVEIDREVYDVLASTQAHEATYYRQARRYHVGSFSDVLEEHCQIQKGEDDSDFQSRVSCALETLTETQRRRVIYRYYDGKTLEEIARLENAGYSSIYESIEAALKKIKIFFQDTR